MNTQDPEKITQITDTASIEESPTIPASITTVDIEHSDKKATPSHEDIIKKGKTMLIVIGVVLLLFFLLILLAFKNKAKPSNAVTTITYWGLWEDKDVMQPLIDEFEQSHPNIKVNYIKQDFGFTSENYAYVGNYYASVLERLTKTGGIDIMRVHVSWIPNIINFISPADNNIFPASEVEKNYYEPVVKASVFNNYVYNIPLYMDSLVMFYNPGLFKKANIENPPTNWEQVITDAPKLTIKENGRIVQAGVAIGTGTNIFHSPQTLLMMFTQANVPVIDYSNKKFVFATEEGLAGLKYYTDFATKSKVWSYTLPSDLKMFVECRLAMLFAPSWRAVNFKASNPQLDFKIAPPPVLPGARNDVNQYIASYYTEIVPQNAPHKKEAWIFLHWLSQPEQLEKFYQLQVQAHKIALPSPRKDVKQDVTTSPASPIVHEMAPKTTTWMLYDQGVWEKQVREFLTTLENQENEPTLEQLRQLEQSLNQTIFKTQ